MRYFNREDELVQKEDKLDDLLKRIYSSKWGAMLIKQICNRNISNVVGCFMKSKYSRFLIKKFIKANNIDMNLYEKENYNSYNDFFIRKTAKGVRDLSQKKEYFSAPCDAKLSIFDINEDLIVDIKNSKYTVKSLLKNTKLANYYNGGEMLIFRLSVDNYHRYTYIDNAKKSKNYRIRGKFYSVSPAVLEKVKVFKENEREYTVLDTENFGKIIHMEVGATLVGKIVNFHQEKEVKRGEEKGYFEFGGSTIVLFIQSNKVKINSKYLNNHYEYEVRMGDIIGTKVE